MAQVASILPRLAWLALPLICTGGCGRSESAGLRFQVASSSMAPGLLGPALLARCGTCQYAFSIAAETYRPELPTRCPNCGGLCDIDPKVQPGQTVVLQPLAAVTDVQRWDVIAFENVADGTTQVKRVWGLPGESLELRHGEAWVDGLMLRKSLAELRRIAVPVYDLGRGGGCRWRRCEAQPRGSEDDWRGVPAALPVLNIQAEQCYQLQCVRPAAVHPSDGPFERWLKASPVIDVYAINQGLSTVDHHVEDGLIRLQLQRPLASPLQISVRSGGRTFTVLFQAASYSAATPLEAAAEPEANGLRQASAIAADFRMAARQRIELGWCDGRLLLETDVQSRVVEAEELESLPQATHAGESGQSGGPAWLPSEICRIATTQEVDISQFHFARDLYLTNTPHPVADRGGRLADELAGFYVLGDNLAASRDSRHELGRVPPARLLGRIVAAPRP